MKNHEPLLSLMLLPITRQLFHFFEWQLGGGDRESDFNLKLVGLIQLPRKLSNCPSLEYESKNGIGIFVFVFVFIFLLFSSSSTYLMKYGAGLNFYFFSNFVSFRSRKCALRMQKTKFLIGCVIRPERLAFYYFTSVICRK
jgi:hypothetical protein